MGESRCERDPYDEAEPNDEVSNWPGPARPDPELCDVDPGATPVGLLLCLETLRAPAKMLFLSRPSVI